MLDRILLSEGLITRWEVVAQEVKRRELSDHKLVWTKSSNTDWGPKAFRVLGCWFDHKDFIPFVHKEWCSLDIRGSKSFVLKEKMRHLRVRLRWWNTHVFGKANIRIDGNVEALNLLEDSLMQPNGSLSDAELLKRRKL